MAWRTASKATKALNANKKIEPTTKAEPILGKFKDIASFCGSSFRRYGAAQIDLILTI